MIKKLLALSVILLLVLPGYVMAQTGSLTGQITDQATGETLPGATVFIPDLNVGQSTNLDGVYRLDNVPAGTHTVRVSFVGYRTLTRSVTITAGETTTMNFGLQAQTFELDDLVVTGYVVQPRRELTGSITQVRGADIENLPIQSFDQALQGRAAGVQVTAASGQPGGAIVVRVRGTGSINAGNDPLYIVDGVQVNMNTDVGTQASSNPLASINPADIESIEILKDAAAASIYGAQAANGVVLITTKRGRAGRTEFRASMQTGWTEDINRYDMVDGPTWMEMMMESYANWRELQFNRQTGESQAYNNYVPNNPLLYPYGRPGITQLDNVINTDWQDEVYRVGQQRSATLSARGGTDNTRFFISGGYNWQEGHVIKSDFNRFQLRSNVDHRANEFFAIEANINLSTTQYNGAIADGNWINGVIFGAPLVRPTLPVRNDDGEFNEMWGFGNPVQDVTTETRFQRNRSIIGNVAGNFSIMNNLIFRSFWGLDFRQTREKNYRPPGYRGGVGTLFEVNREVYNFNTNQVLNYNDSFGDVHNVGGLLGFEYRIQDRNTFSAAAEGFPFAFFQTLQNAATPTGVGGFTSQWKLAGFFSQLRYDYDRKYLVSITSRYDGSSKFGENKKWGFFYSGSFGWNMAEEDFMSNLDWLNEFKFRASYGLTGNSEIPPFASRSLFGSGGSYRGAAGLRPVQLGNDVLTWEEAGTTNFGLDFVILEGRLSGSLDVYRTINKRLLLNRPLVSNSSFGGVIDNIGKVQNQGIEFEFRSVNISGADFMWTTRFTVGYNKNEILSFGDDSETIGTSLRIGHPATGVWFVPRYAGVNPADGRAMWYDKDGNITYQPDGLEDGIIAGKPLPDLEGGISNSFEYKGWSLDVFFIYSYGAQTFKQQETYFLATDFYSGGMLREMTRRWQAPGDITDIPRLYKPQTEPPFFTNTRETPSTRHIEDIDFIRLKQVTLSYQLPSRMANRLNLRAVRVFAQGMNLLTWTSYTGIDPEILVNQAAIYPQARQFTTGIDITF
jgi:TonB-linked SusC/RagA family outer membrane protein